MTKFVKPKDGKLLEMMVNERGILQETDNHYNPRDFSTLGIITFGCTIPRREGNNFEIERKFYRQLVDYCKTECGANLLQIIKMSANDTTPQPWGKYYEATVLMYCSNK